MRPFVFAGPAVGFKLQAKAEIDGEEVGDFDEDVKGADVGLVFGGGIEVARFIFETRYDLGLTNINDESDGSSDIKNRTWRFVVGIEFFR